LGVGTVGLVALSAAGGALLAVSLPNLLPGLTASLLGPAPTAYWYLSRSTAVVAYILLWLAMALGLMMTNKLARLWPGGPLAFDLHEHASILGLAFGLFHALILLGDRYASYSLTQILVPFASGGGLATWVGLGQVGLYLMGVVGLSFYVRPLIGRAGWRLIHLLSFATFGLVLLHGVMSGSDTGAPWAQALYWLSGGSLLFLTVYRVLVSVVKPAPAEAASTDACRGTQTIQA
jgi:predicted ferric reductase